MIKFKDQKSLLATVDEGDMFEHDVLFSCMAPNEQIVWKVMNVRELKKTRVVTFDLFVFDIYWGAMRGTLFKTGGVLWEGVS